MGLTSPGLVGEVSPKTWMIQRLAWQLNKDLVAAGMEPQMLTALVATWLQNGISYETFLYNLQKGEIMRPLVSVEEELALIEIRKSNSLSRLCRQGLRLDAMGRHALPRRSTSMPLEMKTDGANWKQVIEGASRVCGSHHPRVAS